MNYTVLLHHIRTISLAIFSIIFRGDLWLCRSQLTASEYKIPNNFSGICVAPTTSPEYDNFQLIQLNQLGISRVRIDFTYGDANGPAGRLLAKLAKAGFQITLHLLQPYSEARLMPSESAVKRWHTFIVDTLERFGHLIDSVEVTSTINRRRWAGYYHLEGFLSAWGTAHDAIRCYNKELVLCGPNITDFEPIYNVVVLSILRNLNQLPDIHTNNLFAERAIRPENWDHKILGKYLAGLIRFNLIKKARLLARIAVKNGVLRFSSPAAFWTLPRIKRRIHDVEQKQADYLARYFILCAASGVLEQVNWGPLICHREGLIDDGVKDYPKLERITHYASVIGTEYVIRPGFHAFAAFNHFIPGATYKGSFSHQKGLEIHAFSHATLNIHVVWTTNARTASLKSLYDAKTLVHAKIYDRDGIELTGTTVVQSCLASLVVSEKPFYLVWPMAFQPVVFSKAALLSEIVINTHQKGFYYYHYQGNDIEGMVCAENGLKADILIEALQPSYFSTCNTSLGSTLRRGRNIVWTIPDPRSPDALLTIKKPFNYKFHKRLLDRFKPSKARRSWNGTCELLRRGINAAVPVAWIEKSDQNTVLSNWYVCEYMATHTTVRKLFTAFAQGEIVYQGFDAQLVYKNLADFLLLMHNRGIFFRDLSGGNILVDLLLPEMPTFTLIDTGRIRIYPSGVPLRFRIADLTRACHKLHYEGREIFMTMYLKKLGLHFTRWQRIAFYLYDSKASLKRRLHRITKKNST